MNAANNLALMQIGPAVADHDSAIKDSSQMASDPGTASLERELMRLLEQEK